jgi:VWFA-related protein
MAYRWRPVVLSLALLSALTVCSAQQIFRSGVSLVLVDLRVIDKDYRSVADLKAENIEVLVDGRPRPIVGFEYRGDDPALTSQAPVAATQAPALAVQSAPDEPTPSPFTPESLRRGDGRTIVLAVQSNTISLGDGVHAYKGAELFIDHLRTTDRVSVVMLPPASVTHLGFTNNHESLKRRLKFALTHTSNGEWVRAAGPANCDAPAASAASGSSRALSQDCRDAKRAAATELEDEERVRAMGRDFTDLFDALGGIEGPKDVVLVTAAFGLPISEVAVLQDIVRAASRSRVRVHALEISNVSDWVSPELRTSGRAEGLGPEVPRPDLIRLESAALHIATATGGIAMTPLTGGIFFKRLESELAGVYILAFEPLVTERDGKPHKIRVRLRDRAGLTVRARSSFVLPKEAMPAAPAANPPVRVVAP